MSQNFRSLTFTTFAITCIFTFCMNSVVHGNNIRTYRGNAPSVSDIQGHSKDRSIVLLFSKGRTHLTQTSRNKLRELIIRTGTANIDRLEIAVWSDRPFPKTEKALRKSDRRLADLRIKTVTNYLKKYFSLSNFETFNMADSTNWIAKTLRTDEAELKSIFGKDANAPMARVDFNSIVRDGSPSRAVIILVPKNILK